MKIKLGLMSALLVVSSLLVGCNNEQASTVDPLPSWNDSNAKTAIVEFVEHVTNQKSADYVAPADRIATFDNDGTLWSEQPMYFQILFALDRVKEMAAQHPEWQDEMPFAAVLKDDISKLHTEDLVKIVVATHTGMSVEEFDQAVKQWIKTAKHPVTGKPYTDMVFQPMLELLDYLRANDFKTYIVSGGGNAFMRAWVTDVYGIPSEQVIGTRLGAEFKMVDGQAQMMRTPELIVNDDKEAKPQEIYQAIGKRPIAAFGNSDGDLAMLQWTAAGEGLRLPLYIHHTDAEREYQYDRESSIGRLDQGLDEAALKGWPVVDMKNDWKQVYPTK